MPRPRLRRGRRFVSPIRLACSTDPLRGGRRNALRPRRGGRVQTVCRRFRVLTLCGIVALAVDVRAGFAQYNTAEISIIVTDTQGGVLPGVSAVATQTTTHGRIERVSDDAGHVFLPA